MTLNKVINYFILLFLFALPLIPPLYSKGYEEIKVLGLMYGTIGLIILLGIKYKAAKTLNGNIPNLIKIQIIFLLVLLITALTGINSTQSILGGAPYFQGWITFLFLTMLAVCVLIQNISTCSIKYAFILSSSVVAVTAIIQWLLQWNGFYVETYAGRVVSTLGQPNFYAGFILLVLPFLLEAITKSNKFEKKILLGSLALNIVAIIVSKSRTAETLSGMLLIFWLLTTVIKTKTMKYGITIMLFVTMFLSVAISPLLQDEIIRPIKNQTVEYGNAEKRIFIWQIAIEQITKSPFTGFGLENINQALPDNYDFNHPKPAFYKSIKDLNIDNTHNMILNLLLWGGVVALVVLLWLFFYSYRLAKNTKFKIALILFFSWAMVQNLSIIHWVYFYVLMVLIIKQSEGPIDSNKDKKVHLTKLRNK